MPASLSQASSAHGLIVVSYNLRFHMAYEEAFTLAKANKADVICLQECYTDLLQKKIAGYQLAGKTRGPLGLAVYYRPERLTLSQATSHLLSMSLYERISGENGERLLVAKFDDIQAKRPVFVASFHATHLVATNQLRRRQIRETFAYLEHHNPAAHRSPTIIAGDYNYPWFHRRLDAFVKQHEYALYVSEQPTLQNSVFQGRFDLVTARHVKHVRLKVLDRGISDHMAICATITY